MACDASFEGSEAWKPIPEPPADHAQASPPRSAASAARPRPVTLAIAGVAAVLYLSSLFFPALHFARRDPVPGYHVLLWGWWGLYAGSLAWFANPFLVLAGAQFLGGRSGRALAFALLAAALAATAPQAKEWWFSEAAGTRIVGLGVGFRIWLASIAVFLVAAALAVVQERRATGPG